MSFSSVDSAVPSTSKMTPNMLENTSFMAPLMNFLVRGDTVSSMDSESSLATTASIASERSRSRSRSWSWNSSSSRSVSRSWSRSRSRSPIHPKKKGKALLSGSRVCQTARPKRTAEIPVPTPNSLPRSDTLSSASSASSLATTASILSERSQSRSSSKSSRSMSTSSSRCSSRSRSGSRHQSHKRMTLRPRTAKGTRAPPNSRSRARYPSRTTRYRNQSAPRTTTGKTSKGGRAPPTRRSKSPSSSSSMSRSRSPVRPKSTPKASGSRAGRDRPLKAITNTPASKGGRVSKRRKAPRLTMTKTKKGNHTRKAAIEKVLREEAEASNFILSDLKWSEWKQVIRRNPPLSADIIWERRHPDHVGYRRNKIFPNMNGPAVYEFAVQTPEKQKFPVLGSVTMGMNGRHWEGAMLSKPKLREQIDRVLRRGCKLYARKAPFSAQEMPNIYKKCPGKKNPTGRRSKVTTAEAVNELKGLMLSVNDYAWRDHYDIESRTYSHRPVTIDGIKLSD